MTCTANDNSLDPPKTTPIQVPGFGQISSPIQIPISELNLPTEIIEDIVGLVNKLGLQLPSGLLKPNPDNLMKTVMSAFRSLVDQFAPFLSFYNFAMAAFNLFKCIIEILCAIPDPFAIAFKLKKLFSECLPPFMALFPATALVAMIVSLMLLILALIEYIIATIIAVIEDLIKNLDVLSKATELNDAESALAAAQKIAALLCSIQNILAVLIAFAAIISVIETLAKIASGTICADGDDCCTENICPPFIKTTPNGIEVKFGKLIYFKQVGVDVASALSLPPEIAATLSFPPIRAERWQIYDKIGNASFPISSIITPISGNIFWPDLPDFNSTLSLRKAPYTVDLSITLNPKDFGLTDVKGSRKFFIKDCVVVRKPYLGVYYYSNLFQPTPITGTLNVEGGLVYEEDGSSYMIGDSQASLNTFLHQADSSATQVPSSDDSLEFDIEFTWKPNAGALAGYQLTTVGCMPEVSFEKAAQNAIIIANGIGAVVDKLPPTPTGEKVISTGTFLPNIQGTLDCTNNAITEFRKNVSKETAALFQASIETCLNDLKNQTTATLCAALFASVSIFKSTASASPAFQFTSRTVEIKVILNDQNGINIGTNIPKYCADQLASKLTAETTLGTHSNFVYDGINSFISQISSEDAGVGTITVLFDKKVLSKIIPGVVGGSPTVIEEQLLNYTFVDAGVSSPTRRDEKDNN
jgi:hypothetical protein